MNSQNLWSYYRFSGCDELLKTSITELHSMITGCIFICNQVGLRFRECSKRVRVSAAILCHGLWLGRFFLQRYGINIKLHFSSFSLIIVVYVLVNDASDNSSMRCYCNNHNAYYILQMFVAGPWIIVTTPFFNATLRSAKHCRIAGSDYDS